MKRILYAMLLCGLCLEASEIKFASEVKSLYADSTSKKVIGRLLPTTKVEILKKENDRVKVRVIGWSERNKLVALYATPNRRILNAGLSRGVDISFQKIGDKTFEGKQFEEIAMEFYTENSGFVNDVAPLYKEASELYTTNCSMCHHLHALKEYKANQWPSVIKSMLSRTAIPKDKSQLVIQYVQKNASDVENLK